MTTKTDREICDAATPEVWARIIKIWEDHLKIRGVSKIEDLAFISHFNPQKVGAMLEEIERLKAENERLKCCGNCEHYEIGDPDEWRWECIKSKERFRPPPWHVCPITLWTLRTKNSDLY